MEFDVYCDETNPDLLFSKNPRFKYTLIGGLWLPRNQREEVKSYIKRIRSEHDVHSEFKWNKVSWNRLDFYKALIEYFFSNKELRYRCIVIDSERFDPDYHEGDQELGFYKLYYQLLQQWMTQDNRYNVFCDYLRNRRSGRLVDLANCLKVHCFIVSDLQMQYVPSRESTLIQLTDLLTGITSASLNGSTKPKSAKFNLIEQFSEYLGHQIIPTGPCEKKYNVFQIRLST